MKAPGLTRTRRTFFAPIWVALLAAVILTLLLLAAVRVSLYLFSTTTTVVLVRHAEKAPPESGPDPVLSAEGQERALRLARLLGEADVAAVYASDTRRAQLTASPLAARLGVTVTTRAGNDVEHGDTFAALVIVIGHELAAAWIKQHMAGSAKILPGPKRSQRPPIGVKTPGTKEFVR